MTGHLAPLTQTELEDEIKALIVESLKLEGVSTHDIDARAPLVGGGLGLDSIDILELAMAIHKRYGVKTETDDDANREVFSSVAALAGFVAQKRASQG